MRCRSLLYRNRAHGRGQGHQRTADQSTIQAGINAAANGDTVLVAAGTYNENINFSGKAITVTSAGGPNLTIIDGGQNGAVVTFSAKEPRTAVLSGFTIRNGSTNNNYYYGSGVYFDGASPSIVNNIFTSNVSCYSGGAIGGYGGDPLILSNIIAGNTSAMDAREQQFTFSMGARRLPETRSLATEWAYR